MTRWPRHHGRGWHPHPHHRGHERLHLRHGRRSMFWRVYRHGLFLLFMVGLSVAVLGWTFQRGPSAWEEGWQLVQDLQAGGRPLLEDRDALDRLVSRAKERANASVTLYDPSGRMLASNVDPPMPPLRGESARKFPGGSVEMGRRRWAFPIRDGDEVVGYAVAQWRGPAPRQIARGATIFFGVLAVLALASAPLVRTIVSPIEKLTRAARRLGEGDLSTRSGIRRRDEVGELALAFDEMAERLERLVQSQRELLANVSHELRTPLSRTRVALELAAEGDAERARRYLLEIGADLAELERLVADVLTAARLDANPSENLPLHPEPVHPAELVDSAARRFREAWPDRPLIEEVAPELPAIHADPALLRRVLDNLLDNARKYSEDGRPITVRAQNGAGELRIEVVDEGIGLSEEDLQQLFTPFFRSDRSRARGTGGVGLGLALARRIVEAHGGTLKASSAPGAGSTFTVALPLQQPVR